MKGLARIDRKTKQLDKWLPPVKPKGRSQPADEPPIWTPFPDSPQEMAYNWPADECFYGGSAGSGKSDLLLGLAGTKHKRSLILRREFPRLRAMIERSREIYNRLKSTRDKDSYNESLHLWRLSDERTIQLGAIQYEKDWIKFQGQPHDLKAFDELTEFTETQYRSINIWNRTADPDQPCRVVATGNPPTDLEGEWVIDYWGPFLDEDHPNPARPGDLVWYVRIKQVGEGGEAEDIDVEIARTPREEVEAAIAQGKKIERPSIEIDGKKMEGRSRTFIPGKLADNPYLMASGYDKTLDALPEELRVRFRDGVFRRSKQAGDFCVIPEAWVDAAMKRWQAIHLESYLENNRQACIGVDPARGGKDRTAIAVRYGDLIEIFSWPGEETPDGASVAQLVIGKMRSTDNPIVNVDVIGVGSSPYDSLIQANINAIALSGADASTESDRSGKFKFANKRAEWWWRLRESLDPDYSPTLALPPIKGLKSELCTPKWQLNGYKVLVEPKDKIKARLGRSPDLAEAVIYACQSADYAIDFNTIGARQSIGQFTGDRKTSLKSSLKRGVI